MLSVYTNFYRISDEGFERMVKFDQALDLLSEADMGVQVDDIQLELDEHLIDLYEIFKEWHDQEFGADDAFEFIANRDSIETLQRLGLLTLTKPAERY